ncbi:MAG: OadG family protein [Gammaproteobacteria bacterium]|nr:OadG family protein [Gammaproteobacteria bacterium]MDH4254611.1 OadG family protein [Gammaproteobacteria bacterium]MDH5310979.1 OadG family protein [Gammaproteobacteria bacterium]
MESELLLQGLELMLAGMGVVFVFLTALVAATSLMSRLVLRLQPPGDESGPSEEEIAAISAAIARHRRN